MKNYDAIENNIIHFEKFIKSENAMNFNHFVKQ